MAVLQVELDGSWSIEDLGQMLRDLSSGYERLDVLEKAGADLSTETLRANIKAAFNHNAIRYHDVYWLLFREHFHQLKTQYLEKLTLKEIEIASPGVLKAIGDLNPLKVIADFITNWRAQNTERERLRLESEAKERQRKAELLIGVVDKMSVLTSEEQKGSFGEIWLEGIRQQLLEEPKEYLVRLAANSQIISVKVLEDNGGSAAESEGD